jgi:subtilisin family serine protease
MNMSFGSPSYNASLQEAIRVAYGAGILIVAAAGDGGSSIAVYPAAYDQVLAVSAIDPSDQITAWSSYGSDVDFAAPGVAVYSTYKNDSYATLSGTSTSSPLLAGLAALRIAVYTAHDMAVSPDRITRDLVRSAGDLGSAGWDAYYGYGLVDANILVELPLY